MFEPKLISPLLDSFVIGSAISEHDGVYCYPAMREDSDDKYILKVICVPASERQLDALLLSGAYPNAKAAQTYFESLANDIENEAQVLRHLAKLDSFLAYEDYQIVPDEDGVGFQIYLLGSYKRSLAKYFTSKPMTHLGAVNLGIDLCAAMTVCRQAGCLYIDLKPENIFITEDGRYRVGDLGFVPKSSMKYSSVPDKYRSSYTAPEMADHLATLNESLDIYAIGLILYQAYNNNTLPFEGSAPAEVLPPPLYADYEMAEIILKACAPDPKDRWEDPKELGQALVAYMQRNGANDTPIIPPSISAVEPAEEPVTEEVPVEISVEETEQTEELTFMPALVVDETAPSEETGMELQEDEMSDELTDILAQADDLLAHELPTPVIAPDPIEVPMPAPIKFEDEPAEDAVEEEDNDDLDVPEFVAAADTPVIVEDDADFEADEEEAPVPVPRKKGKIVKTIFGWILALAIIAGLAFGGYYYYTNYYLQNINALTLDGKDNTLSITIDSQIDETLLTVVCTDTYGTVKTETVTGGVAYFTDLNPGALYTIHVEISGFHHLTGQTSASYATPLETNILSFVAAIGAEDGSVNLAFTVDGQDTNTWNIVYNAEGEEERSVSFSGHTTTITGLTVGKEYTFRLVPETELYLLGETELTFVAPKLVFAEELTVSDFDGVNLQVTWTAPEDANVDSWFVRCYNDEGYDVTVEVTECAATFNNIDTGASNTIEVTAAGMNQCVRTFVTANPISITNVTGSNAVANTLNFSWEYIGNAPEGGWLLLYKIADTDIEGAVSCEENSADIQGIIPSATYQMTIQAASGATMLGGTFSYIAPEATTFVGCGASADNMYFSMCKTPEVENWDRYDLSDDDYTSVFSVGEKASFLVYLSEEYNISYDEIITLYVIKDETGKIVSADTQSRLWVNMWYRGYCELDIPALPELPGEYTVDIYFNGGAVTTESFTIEAAE